MRYKTIAAASVAAAAAAAIPCGAASASTPDWLTLVNLNTGNPSPLPVVCGADTAGTIVDPACAGVFGTQSSTAEAFGVELPETPQAPQAPPTTGGVPTLANVDMRDFAKWEVCGVAVGSTTEDVECDNSTTAERQPMEPDNGISLVNADASGAFNWSICGIAVLSEVHAFDC